MHIVLFGVDPGKNWSSITLDCLMRATKEVILLGETVNLGHVSRLDVISSLPAESLLKPSIVPNFEALCPQ